MELLVALIVLAVVLVLVIGVPVALLRASAAEQQARDLKDRVGLLSARLEQALLRVNDLERGASSAGARTQASAPPAEADTAEEVQEHEETDAAEVQPTRERPLTLIDAMRIAREEVERRHVAIGSAAEGDDEEEAIDRLAEPATAGMDSARSNPPTPDAGAAAAGRRLSLEEVLAGKVFVWIGAIALVLTAAFLLKLGFDRNIITEPVRVIGAGLFGLAMWVVGERVRRRAPLIAQALCGAAVAVLYATVLAGHNLYGLFGSHGEVWAFVFMAMVTAAAVALARRHGPAVAILGMVGGFMLPPVLAEGFAGPSAGMVLYLLALEVGILAFTGRRGWFGISLLTLVFTVLWSLRYALVGVGAYPRTLTAMLVIGTAVAYLVQTARLHRDPHATDTTRKRALGLAIAAVCSSAAIVALLAQVGGYAPSDLVMLGLLAAGTLVLARLDRRYLALPFVVMGLSLMALFSGSLSVAQQPSLRSAMTVTAVGYGLLFMLGGYALVWRSSDRRAFTLLSALAGPAYLAAIIVLNSASVGWRESWWPYTLLLAGLYALGAWPLLRQRSAAYDRPIAAYTVLAFALACVSVMQGVVHPRVAVCLALLSAVAALVDRRLFIRPLLVASYVVAGLSAALLVAPGPFDLTIRGGAVFNTLLPMYLLPALGFGLIAWCARRAGEARAARALTWLTTAALAVLPIVLTRDIFHPDTFTADSTHLYEYSAYACALLLAAMLTLRLAKRFKLDDLQPAALAIGSTGAVVGLIGGLVTGNPIRRPDTAGGLALGLGLVALYLAPAILTSIWARRQVVADRPPLNSALRAISITLIALFVGLQVRNAFHPGDLHAPSVGMFECATYALAWILLGGVIRLCGLFDPDRQILRQAGSAVFALGLTMALVGNVLLLNPLWNAGSVGQWVLFNGLWYLFGPLLVVLIIFARACRSAGRADFARLAGYTAIGIGLLLLSLLVRQGFSADGVLQLTQRPVAGERYGYSLAWVVYGAALLVAGVFTRLDTLRFGSLAILLIAVGKVFLVDTASLDNLYRVFSYFGLGVTLLGLGYLYQRLVFHRPAPLGKAIHPA